jgi:WD40 repeat protein
MNNREVRALKISPCGKYVFTGGDDGSMKQFDVRTDKLVHDYGEISESAVKAIEICSQGNVLFVGGYDRKLREFKAVQMATAGAPAKR